MRLIDADALLERAVSHGWSTPLWVSDIMIEDAPTIPTESLTDEEQRIFLAAMAREKKVCKEVDEISTVSYEDSLVRICHEIIRKVKDALWT